MDYSVIVEQINAFKNSKCFKAPEEKEISYLLSIGLPAEVIEFYSVYAPIDTIEINDIRLLPISEIIEENTNYTPGYLLTPLGLCVVASTVEGDVYCVHKRSNDYVVTVASHDEIYEGQSTEEIMKGVKPIAKTFRDFLNAFFKQELVVSFYDL